MQQKEAISEPSSNHLVVLCHGILGYSLDLKYFADGLEKQGFVVLRSKSNEVYKSLDGLEVLAKNVKEEIMNVLEQNPQLSRVSFIGNSLGGLVVRAVVKELFNLDDGTFAGLHPGFILVRH
jgi:alpha-beta hydrolase superfamily lysophospholipase